MFVDIDLKTESLKNIRNHNTFTKQSGRRIFVVNYDIEMPVSSLVRFSFALVASSTLKVNGM